MKRAVRTIYTLFYISVAGSLWAVAAYMIFPIESGEIPAIRDNNLFIGLGIALALLAMRRLRMLLSPMWAWRGRSTKTVALPSLRRTEYATSFLMAWEERRVGILRLKLALTP